MAGIASIVADEIAVATCNWLTSMCAGVAVDPGFGTEAIALLDGEAPGAAVAVGLPLSSTAAGVPHAHNTAEMSASRVTHLRVTKPAH